MDSDCNELLLEGKTFCFNCGKSVNAITKQNQPNRYVRRVKDGEYEEHEELNVSDHAVSELAPFIVGRMNVRSQQKAYHVKNIGVSSEKKTEDTQLLEEKRDTSQPPTNKVNTDSVDQENEAFKYFRTDGEVLVSIHKDFKGTTWAEQQKRFFILYTWAHNKLLNKPVPNKEHIKTAAKSASIYDRFKFPSYFEAVSKKELFKYEFWFHLEF